MENTFTSKDISHITGLPLSTIKERAKSLKIPSRKRKRKIIGGLERYFTEGEFNSIKYFKERNAVIDVIYVTRTWEIYESKMNFLTLKQL